MKLIEKKENKLIFTAEIKESLANAIRRYLNQIPVIAIDEIEILKNNSLLYDEALAHRIGLIPLKMEKTAKSCPTLKFNANKEGMVYSGELKGNLEAVYDKIPVTFLNKGQEIEVIAITKLGKGYEHSKFSPGLLFYRNVVDLKIDKNCPEEVVNSCPVNILEIKDGKIKAVNSEKCDMCEACVDFCAKQGKSSIELIPKEELIINLESFGQLSTEDIFKMAIDVLKQDLSEIQKKLK
jgi:DNA-directed RNA polymerase subunit D